MTRSTRSIPTRLRVALLALVVCAFAGISASSALAADSCGYTDNSALPRSGAAFNESTVLRAISMSGTGATTQIAAWYSDEHALTLGVNPATPSVTPMTATPTDHATSPSVGDETAVDGGGRPIYPALFVTDISNSLGSRAGDWQQQANNNSGVAPDDVFGSWKAATKSGSTITPDTDPVANTTFGAGADTSPTGVTYDKYRTEVRWNVGSFGSPGHTYRVQVMVHDGDQNQSGGDVGEACTTFNIPAAAPSISTQATAYKPDGQAISDTAHLTGGFSPTGTVDFRIYSDSSCSGLGTLAGSGTVDSSGNASSGPYTPAGAGHYYWRAFYLGDASNGAVSGPCGAANEDTLVATPHLTIVKEVSKDGGATWHKSVTVHAGDSVKYRFTVTNDGDIGTNLTGVGINELTAIADCDGSMHVVSPSGFTGDLAVGASASFSCSHTMGSSNLTNTANSSGSYTPPGGNPTPVTSANDTAEVLVINPAFTITKTVSPSGAVHVGDTLTYTITVSNTGNTSLDFWLNDHVFGSPATGGCSNYAPGTPATFTIAAGGPDKVLTCTKAAPNQSSYHNEACATGTDSLGQATTHCDDVTTTITHPGFTVTKTVDKTQAHIGDTLTYTITATNTGDDVLHVSNFNDHIQNLVTAGCTFAAGAAPPSTFDLAAGASRVFTCTHVLSGSDANPYTNVACFDATDGVGPTPATFSQCGEASTTPLDAVLTIVKTVDKDHAYDGNTLNYTIIVTNTGRATATDVQVTDLIAGTSHGCGPLSGPAQGGSLAPGASITYTCSYTVLHADEDAGHHIVNTATATGKNPVGDTIGPVNSSATTLILHPAIAIDKTGPATAQAGDKIGYVLTVTNPGDEGLTDPTVSVADQQCNGDPVTLIGKGGDPSPASLDPGDVWTYSCSVQTAVGDTAVHNTATATGCDKYGTCDNANASADTTLTQPAQLVLGARIVPGAANLVGPTGCTAKAFSARVKGTKIATVVFVLDGKVVKRVKNNKASSIALRIDPSKMRIGVHRLVVNITFQSGSGTKPKTMRLSFQRCSRKLTAPRFTG